MPRVPDPVGPVLTSDVILPKVEAAETSASGRPYCGRLKRLNPSDRNSIWVRSVSPNRRLRAASSCHMAGPRTRLRPALPQRPSAGEANAAGLIQNCGVCPAAGTMGTPATTSGRVTAELPSGTSAALRWMLTLTGKPTRAVPMALICHRRAVSAPPPAARNSAWRGRTEVDTPSSHSRPGVNPGRLN